MYFQYMEEKQAYFVTWSTYNTRISIERQELGMKLGEGVYLDDREREVIGIIMREKIKQN